MKENAFRAILKSIKIPESSVAVIFNSETFERTCFVNLTLPVPDLSRVALKDGRGEVVEFQPVKSHNVNGTPWEWDVLAKVELPAFGYNCVVMETSEAGATSDKEPLRIERPAKGKGPSALPASYHLSNGGVRLNFSAGRLVEIFDESSGRSYSSSGIPWNHLRYSVVDITRGALYVGPIVGICDVEWQAQELIEAGPLRWMLRLRGRLGAHPVVQDVILHKGKVSASLRHSQTVLRPERHTGAELPPFHSLVSVSPDHVALSAMYLNEFH